EIAAVAGGVNAHSRAPGLASKTSSGRMNDMYERFTDRCRKVMQLANRHAMRFRHEYIGTEHLLLGLIEEGSGVGIAALKSLGIDADMIRRDIENLIQLGREKAGPQDAPRTPRAKRVVEFSMEEARNMTCDYVGTEHLLLGLLRVSDGIAAVVLTNRGANVVSARQEIAMVLSCGSAELRKERPLAVGAPPPATVSETV